ncbi:hypothetical protein ACQ4PT_041911 [Festuca glaucescens]
MDRGGRPPAVQQVWQDLADPPEGEGWLPSELELVDLGDGRFLLAKTFEAEATSQRFTLLTGVEMMPDGNHSLSSEDASLDDYLILASLVGKQSRGKGLGQGGRSAQPVPLTVVPESVVLELQDTPASSLFGGEDAVSALEVGPGSAGEASVSLLDQPGSPLGLGCVPVGVGPLDGPPSVPQSAGTAVGPILGLACSSSGGEGSELPVSDLCFLNSMFSATPSPLLQPPAHRSPAAPLPSPPSAPLAAPIRPAAFEPVRSSRLAAKPNSGMSTIEKARMVLLKKSGAILHDGPLGKEDLQKYRQIYAKPIPAPFVKAVEDLVEVNMPRKTAIPSQAPGLLVAVA